MVDSAWYDCSDDMIDWDHEDEDVGYLSGKLRELDQQSRAKDARIAALEAQLAERVKVKPLEWSEEISGSWWTAESYRIETFDGGGYAARMSHPQSRSFRTIAFGITFDEAKAAAQADFERRILSALEATPPAPKVTETALPQGVIDLVIAAREFWDANDDLSPESRALDKALEEFSSRVPYAEEPDTLTTAQESGQ